MSEQETVQNEASEQSLAESVSELEKLTQHALEVEGEERDQLVEQIKTKCEEEGLTSDEAESLLEEIGLVQEAKKVKAESKKKAKEDMMPPKAKDDSDEDDDDDSDEEEEEESKKEEVEIQLPKTKAAAMNNFSEKLAKLRKADIMANYETIMKSLDLNEETDEDVVDTKPIDVNDDVEALVEGEDLTPEFKEKATTIFEAAVQAKVNKLMVEKEVELEEKNEEKLTEEVSKIKDELTTQVDNYLNYVSEQWMEENKLAVEKGIRTEITEGFINGMKNLFNEHYIEIPEDKVDVVDDLFQKVEELEEQLNKQIQESVDLKKEVSTYKKEKVVQSLTSGLSDTQAEKVKELAEGVDAEDEKLEEKVQVIKENYFPKSANNSETLVEEVENNENSEEQPIETVTDDVMSRYTSAITRHNK